MKLDGNKEVTYRDKLATIDEEGKRLWIFAKKPKGKLYNYRQIFGYSLLAFLFIVPFIKVNGEPLMLFNVIERKFIIFGVIFWPQDSFLFYLMMLSTILFIILFTVVYGRLFCGWACPQTIFLELVFRKIEWLIDGNPTQQKKLKAQKWNLNKIFKRTLKHTIFWLISFAIVLALLSFILGVETVIQFVTHPFPEHTTGFIALLVFTSVFYFIYAWFREQVCTIMCPYGRLQGVLLDSNSIIVSYDYLRGEPRGVAKKGNKETQEKLGDCIDCKQCVQVCPTGIDIRNGTQLECVNCTACIDACNATMTRIGKPKGLIRFASENGIKNGQKLKLTPRNIAYSVVLVIIVMFLTTLLLTRPDIETNILRDKNFMYQEQGDTAISNIYNVRILNKTHKAMDLTVKLVNIDGELKFFGDDLHIESGEKTEPKMIVYIPKDKIKTKNLI
ncbi:MAG: cytochrome c oxidase accessory protein CcoG, partial [Chlorobi bacterium]|nr:cytochrome c oxidase accessory protein CcoG [Chlorobiota bacterium]